MRARTVLLILNCSISSILSVSVFRPDVIHDISIKTKSDTRLDPVLKVPDDSIAGSKGEVPTAEVSGESIPAHAILIPWSLFEEESGLNDVPYDVPHDVPSSEGSEEQKHPDGIELDGAVVETLRSTAEKYHHFVVVERVTPENAWVSKYLEAEETSLWQGLHSTGSASGSGPSGSSVTDSVAASIASDPAEFSEEGRSSGESAGEDGVQVAGAGQTLPQPTAFNKGYDAMHVESNSGSSYKSGSPGSSHFLAAGIGKKSCKTAHDCCVDLLHQRRSKVKTPKPVSPTSTFSGETTASGNNQSNNYSFASALDGSSDYSERNYEETMKQRLQSWGARLTAENCWALWANFRSLEILESESPNDASAVSSLEGWVTYVVKIPRFSTYGGADELPSEDVAEAVKNLEQWRNALQQHAMLTPTTPAAPSERVDFDIFSVKSSDYAFSPSVVSSKGSALHDFYGLPTSQIVMLGVSFSDPNSETVASTGVYVARRGYRSALQKIGYFYDPRAAGEAEFDFLNGVVGRTSTVFYNISTPNRKAAERTAAAAQEQYFQPATSFSARVEEDGQPGELRGEQTLNWEMDTPHYESVATSHSPHGESVASSALTSSHIQDGIFTGSVLQKTLDEGDVLRSIRALSLSQVVKAKALHAFGAIIINEKYHKTNAVVWPNYSGDRSLRLADEGKRRLNDVWTLHTTLAKVMEVIMKTEVGAENVEELAMNDELYHQPKDWQLHLGRPASDLMKLLFAETSGSRQLFMFPLSRFVDFGEKSLSTAASAHDPAEGCSTSEIESNGHMQARKDLPHAGAGAVVSPYVMTAQTDEVVLDAACDAACANTGATVQLGLSAVLPDPDSVDHSAVHCGAPGLASGGGLVFPDEIKKAYGHGALTGALTPCSVSTRAPSRMTRSWNSLFSFGTPRSSGTLTKERSASAVLSVEENRFHVPLDLLSDMRWSSVGEVSLDTYFGLRSEKKHNDNAKVRRAGSAESTPGSAKRDDESFTTARATESCGQIDRRSQPLTLPASNSRVRAMRSGDWVLNKI